MILYFSKLNLRTFISKNKFFLDNAGYKFIFLIHIKYEDLKIYNWTDYDILSN